MPSTITGNYYVFIKSTSTNTSIWQQSSIGNVTSSTLSRINNTGSYSNVVTSSGGYILNNITTTTSQLNNNIIYAPASLIVNNYSYSDSAPLFIIISNGGITIDGYLNTTGGSINIIGNNTNGDGIYIPNNISMNGTITLNGTSSTTINAGINIQSTIAITGNVILNGMSANMGILVIGLITVNDNSILTVNGTTTSGRGIQTNTGLTTIGKSSVLFNGVATSGIGINLYTSTITNNNNGIVTINGTGATGINISNNLTINGSMVYFTVSITALLISNILMNSGSNIIGKFNFGITANSKLSSPGNYKVVTNIPASNIGISLGITNNMNWNIVETQLGSTNWLLQTTAMPSTSYKKINIKK